MTPNAELAHGGNVQLIVLTMSSHRRVQGCGCRRLVTFHGYRADAAGSVGFYAGSGPALAMDEKQVRWMSQLSLPQVARSGSSLPPARVCPPPKQGCLINRLVV
jgi:hypothetical protein